MGDGALEKRILSFAWSPPRRIDVGKVRSRRVPSPVPAMPVGVRLCMKSSLVARRHQGVAALVCSPARLASRVRLLTVHVPSYSHQRRNVAGPRTGRPLFVACCVARGAWSRGPGPVCKVTLRTIAVAIGKLPLPLPLPMPIGPGGRVACSGERIE